MQYLSLRFPTLHLFCFKQQRTTNDSYLCIIDITNSIIFIIITILISSASYLCIFFSEFEQQHVIVRCNRCSAGNGLKEIDLCFLHYIPSPSLSHSSSSSSSSPATFFPTSTSYLCVFFSEFEQERVILRCDGCSSRNGLK